MKHSVIQTLAAGAVFLLLLSSCANGAPENDAASVSGTAGAAAAGDPDAGAELADAVPDEVADESPDPAAAVEEAAAPEKTPEELLATAMEYIGKPVDDLIAVIGEPDDRDYAPSCMGEGEDGNLYYGGFIVYTYRENGEETIQDVE